MSEIEAEKRLAQAETKTKVRACAGLRGTSTHGVSPGEILHFGSHAVLARSD
jgi:hypothetical protein